MGAIVVAPPARLALADDHADLDQVLHRSGDRGRADLEFAVELAGVSTSILKISPYAQTPGLPVAGFSAAPVLSMVAIALLLAGSGLVALRRRNLR
ncbi:hypothetical protein GCM10009804_16160 [Kribbella hippodromi]|uniref:LPXTG cell wall anchor domain-containing protein n=1 Tax=Kribbella hippodromi TaxID=434347 RepID=A0ABN2CKH9_9ACTN